MVTMSVSGFNDEDGDPLTVLPIASNIINDHANIKDKFMNENVLSGKTRNI